MEDEIERVARALAFEAERMSRDAPADAQAGFEAMARAALEASSIASLRQALEEIDQWSRAYPLELFSEPDVAGVTRVLTEAGMREQMDRLHASWARHIVLGVGDIASAALKQGEQ